jgi:hypothetical protein
MLPVCYLYANVLHVPFPWQVSPKQLNAEKPTTLETLQAWTSIEPDSARHGLGWSILLQSKPVQKVERETFQYFLVTLPSLVMDSQQNVCGCIANSKIMQTAATWIWYVYIYILYRTLTSNDANWASAWARKTIEWVRSLPCSCVRLWCHHHPWSLMSKWLRIRKTVSFSPLSRCWKGQSVWLRYCYFGDTSLHGVSWGYPKVRNPQNIPKPMI